MSKPAFPPLARLRFRQVAVFLGCCLLGLGAGMIVSGQRDFIYEARAKHLVRYVVERLSGPESTKSRYGQEVIQAEIELLESNDLTEQAARSVGLDRLLPENSAGDATVQAAGHEIRKGLKVTAVKNSNVIQLAYRHPDPELAVDVLNALIDQYWKAHLRVRKPCGDPALIQREIEQIQNRLTQTEDELISLQNDSTTSPDEIEALDRQKAALIERHHVLQSRLEQSRIDQVLDPVNRPNVTILHRPTQAHKVHKPQRWGLIAGLAFGGPILGTVLAFLMASGSSRGSAFPPPLRSAN